MGLRSMGGVSGPIRTLFAAGRIGDLDDRELLDRYLGRDAPGVGPEASRLAFEAIVARHGPMVLGVCRRVLGDHHDAADAFQATFLVLVRRAGSIRPDGSLGGWLHGVARRVASRARRARRKAGGPWEVEPAASGPDAERAELREAIDEEIGRLPEAYRLAVVLCDLEGLSYEQAASRIGRPVGTIRSRLARGRRRLRDRLERRGLAPGPLLASTSWMRPAPPPSLLAATSSAGATASVAVPATVVRLVRGVIWEMRSGLYRKFMAVAVGLGSAGADAFGPFSHTDPAPAGPLAEPQVDLDPELARAVDGRIAASLPIDKDAMVLSYLPQWDHGDVDNLGVESNRMGGVRTYVSWPEPSPEDLGKPGRRFVLATYARGTHESGRAGAILAYRVLDDWPERLSWMRQPAIGDDAEARVEFEPGPGWKLFDVTSAIVDRSGESRAGRGLMLRFEVETLQGGPAEAIVGYQIVSREGEGQWEGRRPVLLVVDAHE